jgi:hypothetical protein
MMRIKSMPHKTSGAFMEKRSFPLKEAQDQMFEAAF